MFIRRFKERSSFDVVPCRFLLMTTITQDFNLVRNTALDTLKKDHNLLIVLDKIIQGMVYNELMGSYEIHNDHNGGYRKWTTMAVVLNTLNNGIGIEHPVRKHDEHNLNHDDSWISVWNTCGNPLYISRYDKKTHLSTCASGRNTCDAPSKYPIPSWCRPTES